MKLCRGGWQRVAAVFRDAPIRHDLGVQLHAAERCRTAGERALDARWSIGLRASSVPSSTASTCSACRWTTPHARHEHWRRVAFVEHRDPSGPTNAASTACRQGLPSGPASLRPPTAPSHFGCAGAPRGSWARRPCHGRRPDNLGMPEFSNGADERPTASAHPGRPGVRGSWSGRRASAGAKAVESAAATACCTVPMSAANG
jgi:hypothetical protein